MMLNETAPPRGEEFAPRDANPGDRLHRTTAEGRRDGSTVDVLEVVELRERTPHYWTAEIISTTSESKRDFKFIGNACVPYVAIR